MEGKLELFEVRVKLLIEAILLAIEAYKHVNRRPSFSHRVPVL